MEHQYDFSEWLHSCNGKARHPVDLNGPGSPFQSMLISTHPSKYSELLYESEASLSLPDHLSWLYSTRAFLPSSCCFPSLLSLVITPQSFSGVKAIRFFAPSPLLILSFVFTLTGYHHHSLIESHTTLPFTRLTTRKPT